MIRWKKNTALENKAIVVRLLSFLYSESMPLRRTYKTQVFTQPEATRQHSFTRVSARAECFNLILSLLNTTKSFVCPSFSCHCLSPLCLSLFVPLCHCLYKLSLLLSLSPPTQLYLSSLLFRSHSATISLFLFRSHPLSVSFFSLSLSLYQSLSSCVSVS